MSCIKSTPKRGRISRGNTRTIPLDTKTAKELGGGARGRTIALIYRQMVYWSKYAKWTGKNGKKFFYKSQKELADELCMSEKTINRGIKALKELGLVIVEKLHKRYWRQVNFYFLPKSPYAAASTSGATARPEAAPAPVRPSAAPTRSTDTTNSTKTSTTAGAGGSGAVSGLAVAPLAAAAATAASIRARGGGGFSQNVRIQQKKDYPSIKHSLQTIVERCNVIGLRMKNEQEDMITA